MPVFDILGEFAHILCIKFRSLESSKHVALFLAYSDNFVVKIFEVSGWVSVS